MKREQRFIKMVSRRMAKAGFECKIVDDLFIVINDGKPFEVKMWNTPGWGRRRVHFNLSFAFKDMGKVRPEALMWLASESNNHSDYATTHFWNDHFSCCVETSVRTAKEFEREFCFAYKQIGMTYKNLSANYFKIKDQFRVRRPIGFMTDRNMEEMKKENACKLVAQTYTNFAAK